MKTRKVKRLWFLEKVAFSVERTIFIGGRIQKHRPLVGEGVVWDYANGFLCVAPRDNAFGDSQLMKLESITQKFGKLEREECLTYGNSIIRKIGLDKTRWT